ncbi:MAG: hypothetical protein HY791_12720 [Deltaproteobacteria bacterium]|nr:hypothetical protein [Deltaproteobacteria bacterium]
MPQTSPAALPALEVLALIEGWHLRGLIDAPTYALLRAEVGRAEAPEGPGTLDPVVPAEPVASPEPVAVQLLAAAEPSAKLVAEEGPSAEPVGPPAEPPSATPEAIADPIEPPTDAPIDGAMLGKIEGRDLHVLSSEAVLWFTGVVLVLAGSLYFTRTNWSAWSDTTRALVSAMGLSLYGLGFAGLGRLVAARLANDDSAFRERPARILSSVAIALLPITGLALAHFATEGTKSAGSISIALLAGVIAFLGATIAAKRVEPGLGVALPIASAATLFSIGLSPGAEGLGAVALTAAPGLLVSALALRSMAPAEGPKRLGTAALVYLYGATMAAAVFAAGPDRRSQVFAVCLALFGFVAMAANLAIIRFFAVGAAILAVPLALNGSVVPVSNRVAVLFTALLSTATLLRVARQSQSRLAAVFAATFGLLAYDFSPAPFNALIELLLGAAKQAFGYTNAPLPVAYFALTFFPYLIAIALIVWRLRQIEDARVAKLVVALRVWLLVASVAIAALSLSSSDPRPAMLSLPLYAVGYAIFARRPGREWLLHLSAASLGLALFRGLAPLGASAIGLAALALVWPYVTPRLTAESRPQWSASIGIAIAAAIAALGSASSLDGVALFVVGVVMVLASFATNRAFLGALGVAALSVAPSQHAGHFDFDRFFDPLWLAWTVAAATFVFLRRSWSIVLAEALVALNILFGVQAARSLDLDGHSIAYVFAALALFDFGLARLFVGWSSKERPWKISPSPRVPSMLAFLILFGLSIAGVFERTPAGVWLIAAFAAALLASSVQQSFRKRVAAVIEASLAFEAAIALTESGPIGLAVVALLLSIVSVSEDARRRTHRVMAAIGFVAAVYSVRDPLAGFELTLVLTLAAAALVVGALRKPTELRAVAAAIASVCALGSAALAIPPQLGLPGGVEGQLPVVAAALLLSSFAIERIAAITRRRGFTDIASSLVAIARVELGVVFALCVFDSVTKSSTGLVHGLLYLDFVALLIAAVRAAGRTRQARYAFLAEAVLAAAWAKARSKGLFAGSENADAIFMLFGALAATGLHTFVRRTGGNRAFEVAAKWSALSLPPLALLISSPEATFGDAGLALSGAIIYLLAGAVGTSRLAGPLAALMLNIAVGMTWLRTGISTPQAHAIPLAASILVLVHVYRDVLSAKASAWIRLVALGGAYVSGFATLLVFDSPVEALVMASACVAGVALGALFRIKSYLFLGAGFLVADLGTNLVRFGLSGHVATTIVLTGLGLVLLASMVTWSLNRVALTERIHAFRAELAVWST